MKNQVIKTKPEPYCPRCGAKMNVRRPIKDWEIWNPFWSCMDFPWCMGRRDILPDGRPETDEDL